MKQARLLDRGWWKPAFIFRHQIYVTTGDVILWLFVLLLTMLLRPFFSEYQLHLSLVSYLLIEWLLISFQMWKAERHQNNLPYLHFFRVERNFIHETLARPGKVFIDRETFKTIPRCLSSMFMRFEKCLVGWISSKSIYRTSCQNLYYDWKHLIQRFQFLFDLWYWDAECLN